MKEPSIILEATEVLSPETELLTNDQPAERVIQKHVERNTREQYIVEVPQPQPKADPPAPPVEQSEARASEPVKEETIVPRFENFLSQVSQDTKGTVCVTRRPDGYENRGAFNKPCNTTMDCDPVRLEPGMNPEDVYTTVKEREESGGIFFFQIREGKGFTGITWEATLSNPKVKARPEPAASIPAPPVVVAASPNPLDAVIVQANKIRELREALFPASEQRQPATTQPATVDPITQLIADRLHTDTSLQKQVFDYLFSKDEPGESEGTLISIVKEVLQNPQGAFELLGGALQAISMMRGGQQPQRPATGAQQGAAQPAGPKAEQEEQMPIVPGELLSVLNVIVEDITRAASVERSLEAVMTLAAQNPKYEKLPSEMASVPASDNLDQVAHFAEAPHVPMMPHSIAWMNKLLEAIKARIAIEPQPIEPQSTERTSK